MPVVTLIPPWRPLDEAQIMQCPVFSVRRHRMREDPVPDEPHQKEGDFYVIDAPDWVNVVAFTPEDELILIEQWRHGVAHTTMEIPGGMIDAGEAPEVAAARELAEETGYRAQSWQALGVVEPNPAIQANRCHTYLALDCELSGGPTWDHNERIEVLRVPYAEVPDIVAAGKVSHALVVAALSFESLRRAGRLRSPPRL
jgi:ADP-ribose pyrophosphatase